MKRRTFRDCGMNERKSAKAGSKMQSSNTSSAKHPALNREGQNRIGKQLRAMYNDVVAQGIPDRFTQLLKQLDDRPDEHHNNGHK